MPVTKTWAGGTFNLPVNREPKGSWGTEVSNFLISLATNAIALTGGTQTLSAELNFGATYGLVSAYVKSAAANIASTGTFRLAKTDTVAWRNNANGADLALGIDGSDDLTFNGTKVSLSGSIANADVSTSAAIALSKLAALTASRALVSDDSGVVSASAVTASELGYLSGASSSLQTQLDSKQATLPSQNGNGGKVLSTDGSALSWASAASSTLTQNYTDIGDSTNTRTATNTKLLGDVVASSVTAGVTVTIASPAVVTYTSHGLNTNDKIYFATTGALPTGLTAATTYWVTVIDANTLKLSSSLSNAIAGTFINTSGTQSGSHTAFAGGLKLDAVVSGAKTFGSGIAFNGGGSNLNYYAEDDTTTTTFTFNGSGGTSGSNTLHITRIGRIVVCTIAATNLHATTGTGSNTFTANTAIPSQYRPSIPVIAACTIYESSTNETSPGWVQVSTAGVISILKDNNVTAFSTSTDCGVDRQGVQMVWSI